MKETLSVVVTRLPSLMGLTTPTRMFGCWLTYKASILEFGNLFGWYLCGACCSEWLRSIGHHEENSKASNAFFTNLFLSGFGYVSYLKTTEIWSTLYGIYVDVCGT